MPALECTPKKMWQDTSSNSEAFLRVQSPNILLQQEEWDAFVGNRSYLGHTLIPRDQRYGPETWLTYLLTIVSGMQFTTTAEGGKRNFTRWSALWLPLSLCTGEVKPRPIHTNPWVIRNMMTSMEQTQYKLPTKTIVGELQLIQSYVIEKDRMEWPLSTWNSVQHDLSSKKCKLHPGGGTTTLLHVTLKCTTIRNLKGCKLLEHLSLS